MVLGPGGLDSSDHRKWRPGFFGFLGGESRFESQTTNSPQTTPIHHYCSWIIARWWFQIFSIFTTIWGRFPIWLIFFRWVETTNQIVLFGILFPMVFHSKQHTKPEEVECWFTVISDIVIYLAGNYITYPTSGRGKSSSKVPFLGGIC